MIVMIMWYFKMLLGIMNIPKREEIEVLIKDSNFDHFDSETPVNKIHKYKR